MVNLRVKSDKHSKAPPGKSFVQSLHSTHNHRKYYSIGPNNEKWLGIKEINGRKTTLRISWWYNYSTHSLKINLRKWNFLCQGIFFHKFWSQKWVQKQFKNNFEKSCCLSRNRVSPKSILKPNGRAAAMPKALE